MTHATHIFIISRIFFCFEAVTNYPLPKGNHYERAIMYDAESVWLLSIAPRRNKKNTTKGK